MDSDLQTSRIADQSNLSSKRRRISHGESDALSSQTVEASSEPRVTTRRKKSQKSDKLVRDDAPSPREVICVAEWPDLFKSLEVTHRALNLVFTFCCTRKHLSTTFETIKSAVETHTKKTLVENEVAMIVALRPEGINFTYVDELKLELEARGSERDDTFKPSRALFSQSFTHDASVGGSTGKESLDDYRRRESGERGREVLFFEFIDGDLKRQVQDSKTGEAVKPNRKLRDEKLKMPVYGQKQMMQLIERRNRRFTNAINVFLSNCSKDELDPERTLKQLAHTFVPKRSACETISVDLESGGVVPADVPKQRKSIPEIVLELKGSPWYTGQIVPDGHRVFEPQEAVCGELDFLLSQNLINAIYNAKGITGFYAHQAEALNRLHKGQNVVVATSTSSGKSLIYQLPVVHALEQDYLSRAMYIFPTKALAQDQKRSLKQIFAYMPDLEDALVETFDGDTPMMERNVIREEARVIFTNPDMLHITILPQEARWRSFLQNLKYVVGSCVIQWIR